MLSGWVTPVATGKSVEVAPQNGLQHPVRAQDLFLFPIVVQFRWEEGRRS